VFPTVYNNATFTSCVLDRVSPATNTSSPILFENGWCSLKSGDIRFHGQWGTCAPIGSCQGSPECSGRGVCEQGLCACESGFEGPDCSTPVDLSSERGILQQLHSVTKGSEWLSSDHWLSSQPVCTWFGVQCDVNGHVTKLNLSSNALDGQIPPQLSNLMYLQHLDLSNNHLTGSIPDSIGQLRKLVVLDLSKNHLHGDVPLSFLDLSVVQHITITDNVLTSPSHLVESLRKKTIFDCDGNCITDCQMRADSCAFTYQSQQPTNQ
jgi:hypothetical protein